MNTVIGEPPVVDADWGLFTPAHDRLRADVRDWVGRTIAPNADAWEEAGDFPRELFAQAGAAGLFAHKYPTAVGGCGPDFLADAVVSEELALCGSGGVAAGLGAHKDLGPYYLWRFGTDAQRGRWVVPAVRGDIVGALAVTEPGAGSDVAGLRSHATPAHGGDWVLEGAKTFITNGSRADVVVVAALTDPQAGGHHGLTLFAVESGDPGFTSHRFPTLGWRTSHTAELHFERVLLPADRVVGGEEALGQGFVAIMRNFQWERVGMALGAVRSSEKLLADLGSDPRLPDLSAEVAAARALTNHALRLCVHGVDAVREVSMAKRLACALAVRVAQDLLALQSPRQTAERTRLERSLRDARLGPIGGGTTQIMDEVVARTYGL